MVKQGKPNKRAAAVTVKQKKQKKDLSKASVTDPKSRSLITDKSDDVKKTSEDKKKKKKNKNEQAEEEARVERVVPDTAVEAQQLISGLKNQADKLIDRALLTQPKTRTETLAFFQALCSRIQDVNSLLLASDGIIASAQRKAASSGLSFSESLEAVSSPKDALMVSYLALSQLLDAYTTIQALKGINCYDGSDGGRKINEISLLETLTRTIQATMCKDGIITLEGSGRLNREASERFVLSGLAGNDRIMCDETNINKPVEEA
eukprot:GHVH01008213.1.p1 GENE.GHVH01008213.1~~GHVH01008213.1.p1  ORF type:complete len:263 (+),score=50.55 GHVH01008213.1:51-839(+)